MPQLRSEIHGADRDGDRIGAQHGEERDDEGRAVLQVEQHAVAALHATAVLQLPRESFHAALQLRISQRLALKDRGGLLRETARRIGEQVVQPQRRQRQAARHARGPMAEVARFHGAEV